MTLALEEMALEPRPSGEGRPSHFQLDAQTLDAQVIERVLPQVAAPTEETREPTAAFAQNVSGPSAGGPSVGGQAPLRARYTRADAAFFAAIFVLMLILGGVFTLAWANATRSPPSRGEPTPSPAATNPT